MCTFGAVLTNGNKKRYRKPINIIMKKILLMAVVALMATTQVNAQLGYDTKHEVAITTGAWSNSDIINAFETVGTALVGATYGDEDFFGPISVEYFYHVNSWFGVGGIGAYGQMTQDLFLNGKKNGKDADIKNYYLTLMPAIKVDWLRMSHFGMYSKLGIGGTLRHEKIDYDNKDDYTNTGIHLNWQLSLLGMEAGGTRLRAFVELGTGEQGIALLGLRYKF
jgi:hypothetical protein